MTSDVEPVRIWQQGVPIPTYGVGEPDPNPMFLSKRVYQGSSGKVYPLPVIERIDNEVQDRIWQAFFLENRYLRIMVLPELGGRVQMALDKTNDYHFVYYNRVIKPALVGLAGPWISGGIEFNWPQHHRPNTFGPVDTSIQHHEDGSATLWCHEIDKMHGSESRHGFRLYPHTAYLEVDVRLFNRTAVPQTFLWWANPAVHVNDDHQSIFPPDVHAVMDHGKRDVSRFPIASGTYYKVDYSPGTDISRYRNIPVPTSYMAYHSDYDFVGSYDHGRQAGLLHVADHHVSPGKKQWTWGTGDFGRAWERHLTDEDGPYIELMCGVYTDNQPDFSWLAPGEEKRFCQYFMPYKGVGMIGNANRNVALGMDVHGRQVQVRVYTTAVVTGAQIILESSVGELQRNVFAASPDHCYVLDTMLEQEVSPHELTVRVLDSEQNELIHWTPPDNQQSPIPTPAQAIDEPARIPSTELLLLAGLHLEQYRHATRSAADYYDEALRRDPGDSRCNTARGRLMYQAGCFEQAIPYFQKAVERLTRHNPNPYDGEALYYLGITHFMLGHPHQARAALAKATWNAAWQVPAFYYLACIAARLGQQHQAIEDCRKCLRLNRHHAQAAHLLIWLTARTGETASAIELARQELTENPFNFGAMYELARLQGDGSDFEATCLQDANTAVEMSLDYRRFGDDQSAASILQRFTQLHSHTPSLFWYHLADVSLRLGQIELTSTARASAKQAGTGLMFANKLEEVGILTMAMQGEDPLAAWHLGNFWFDRREPLRALECWRFATHLNPTFAKAWRNLALVLFNHCQDPQAAWDAIIKANQFLPDDARILFELDQLAMRLGHDPQQRLARLQHNLDIVQQRDDLFLQYVTLLNLAARHEEALQMLLSRTFHPWEGGEGKVAGQYALCCAELAKQAIDQQQWDTTIARLHDAMRWPDSLGEGKLPGLQENHLHFLLGLAHKGLHQSDEANRYFRLATEGQCEPVSAIYYNDSSPDMVFYQGLAWKMLGDEDLARERFQALIDYGKDHFDDEVQIDYFAVSLPDFLVFEVDLQQRHHLHCQYVMALGCLGQGRIAEARAAFTELLSVDPAHSGAASHLRWCVDAENKPAESQLLFW